VEFVARLESESPCGNAGVFLSAWGIVIFSERFDDAALAVCGFSRCVVRFGYQRKGNSNGFKNNLEDCH
jgi:hypothetical protein